MGPVDASSAFDCSWRKQPPRERGPTNMAEPLMNVKFLNTSMCDLLRNICHTNAPLRAHVEEAEEAVHAVDEGVGLDVVEVADHAERKAVAVGARRLAVAGGQLEVARRQGDEFRHVADVL